jgi:hypothetical protein
MSARARIKTYTLKARLLAANEEVAAQTKIIRPIIPAAT